MRLQRYISSKDFLEIAQDYLVQNEALNNLMLGIALRLVREPAIFNQVYLATVMEKDKVMLVALLTVPNKLLVYSDHLVEQQALDLLVQDLFSGGYSIPGVLGPQILAQGVAHAWTKAVPSQIKLIMPMGVYELQQVNLALIGSGQLRLAGIADIHLLAEGIFTLLQDTSSDGVVSLKKSYETARTGIERKSIYVWENEGIAVSMAAEARPTLRGASINMVYTPESFRGRGFATSCVASLSQLLLDRGYDFCTLFTDLRNATSNSIYQKIGYELVGHFADYAIYLNKERGHNNEDF